MAVIKNRHKFFVCIFTLFCNATFAQVLPVDRVDTLYHSYDGGGITVHGPSVLVRKSVADNISLSANYYVDSISSASVDVVSRASRYSEERTQESASIDYLSDNSILSYSYISSIENDFIAKTNNFSISQEMFGGLTTVSLGFQVGNNEITRKNDLIFHKNATSKGYRVSVSQVLSKDILLGAAYEVITDSGFLNNPYREVRYYDPNETLGYNFEYEVYPQSHTSNAVGVSLKYYLPYRAAISGGYRFFVDSWGIAANNMDIGYVHPYEDSWLFDFSYRFYSQTKASFYSDLFEAQHTFLARDKELSTYSSHSLGAGATYKLTRDSLKIFDKGTINFYYNFLTFNYDDFRDIPYGKANNLQGGTEPMYQFNASVIRFYLSAWF